jgi:hypothetical protein
MTAPFAHDAPPEAAPPLLTPQTAIAPARRRSAAEEARTIAASGTSASLATLSEGGEPWASLVTYGLLDDGSPVLLVSTLAEHGRNLRRDPRASLVVCEGREGDPLEFGRVTLAGRVEEAHGERREEALAAHLAAVPTARLYAGFGDFSVWILRVERVRWVGGFGRMASASASAYRDAEPDPTAPAAAHAIAHLNEDHADALLAIARSLGGHPDATAAACTGIDRYGVDLGVVTPRGAGETRVGFAQPATAPDGLRAATVELARRARAA